MLTLGRAAASLARRQQRRRRNHTSPWQATAGSASTPGPEADQRSRLQRLLSATDWSTVLPRRGPLRRLIAKPSLWYGRLAAAHGVLERASPAQTAADYSDMRHLCAILSLAVALNQRGPFLGNVDVEQDLRKHFRCLLSNGDPHATSKVVALECMWMQALGRAACTN